MMGCAALDEIKVEEFQPVQPARKVIFRSLHTKREGMLKKSRSSKNSIIKILLGE
jgi:hypothetical protein